MMTSSMVRIGAAGFSRAVSAAAAPRAAAPVTAAGCVAIAKWHCEPCVDG